MKVNNWKGDSVIVGKAPEYKGQGILLRVKSRDFLIINDATIFLELNGVLELLDALNKELNGEDPGL